MRQIKDLSNDDFTHTKTLNSDLLIINIRGKIVSSNKELDKIK